MTDAFECAARRTEEEHRTRSRYRRARFHRKAFHIHAICFASVQALLVVIWALQWQFGGTEYPWFLYALGGWGVGLAIHYAVIRDAFREGVSGGSAGEQAKSHT